MIPETTRTDTVRCLTAWPQGGCGHHTHGHFDHTGGNRRIVPNAERALNSRTISHACPVRDTACISPSAEISPPPTGFLTDGGDVPFGVPACVWPPYTRAYARAVPCFWRKVFTGNTLCADAWEGPTSPAFPPLRWERASGKTADSSDNTVVYPGHGPSTPSG